MLGEHDVCAVLAVKDLAGARTFYEEKLGLKMAQEIPNGGGLMFTSGHTAVFLYVSDFAGTNQATAAGWRVDDVKATVEALKAKGVAFERYDLPGTSVEGDVHVMGDMHSAWFKDPAGNILNITNMG